LIQINIGLYYKDWYGVRIGKVPSSEKYKGENMALPNTSPTVTYDQELWQPNLYLSGNATAFILQ
jgi:hypothetical protein